MGKVFGKIIVMLCFTVLMASAAQAKVLKEVHLRDGGIIECQKAWQTNGKVMVLVNRDTLVELTKDEVDLKKTFGKKPVKAKKTKIRKKRTVATAGKPEAAAQSPAQPQPASPPAPPPPAVKPAAPAAQPPAAKAPVQGAATSVKKMVPSAAETPPRTTLPLAKPEPSPPPPEKSFFAANMVNIALGVLLILLVVGYVFYKKRQR